MKSKSQPRCERILVIRYRFIGDTILTVPFLRNLRAAYPHAIIDVLVGPKSGEVLQNCPYINELIPFDTTRFHKYDRGEGKPKTLLSYALTLRKRKYDTVFVLKRSFGSALLAFLSGARLRVGYRGKGHCFLTHKVPFDTGIHEVESLLANLTVLQIPVTSKELEIFPSEAELSGVRELVPELSEPGGRVLIHAAAAHPDKMYPLASFAELIRRLFEELALKPVFSGDKQDIALYDELATLAGVPCLNLAGRLSLRESMALYTFMDLAVCVDSGPSHLAASAGVPTVTLFGPTDPVRWGPYGSRHRAVFDAGLACRPCHYHKTCDNRPCLTELSPELIFKVCKEQLNLTSQPASPDRQAF